MFHYVKVHKNFVTNTLLRHVPEFLKQNVQFIFCKVLIEMHSRVFNSLTAVEQSQYSV